MNPSGDSLGFLGAFVAGVVVSFSPCIYPLIPLTLSFIGARGGGSRIRGLVLSLIYVFGIALTYSLLGLFASLGGRLFGEFAAHPLSFLILGNACIISGLSFFDLININFFGLRLQNRIKLNSGFISAFFFGLVSGLAVSPCVSPALGTILLYVSGRQNIIYGATLMFVFALGMGFTLVLVGTFGTFFLNIPKSAVWLKNIRRLAGLLLILMGEYFLIKAGRLM